LRGNDQIAFAIEARQEIADQLWVSLAATLRQFLDPFAELEDFFALGTTLFNAYSLQKLWPECFT
jgi:hypothetical protein